MPLPSCGWPGAPPGRRPHRPVRQRFCGDLGFSLNAVRIVRIDCVGGPVLAYNSVDGLRGSTASTCAPRTRRGAGRAARHGFGTATRRRARPAKCRSSISPTGLKPPRSVRETQATSAKRPKLDELTRRDRELQADPRRAEEGARVRNAPAARDRNDRRRPAQTQSSTDRCRRAGCAISSSRSPPPRNDCRRWTTRKRRCAPRSRAAALVVAGVLAALQRMGRQPPPALMVSPDDALQSVRSAMLLGAVLPEMRQDVEALLADISALAASARRSPPSAPTLEKNLTGACRRPGASYFADGAAAAAAGRGREIARRRAPARRTTCAAGGRPARADRQDGNGTRPHGPHGAAGRPHSR